MKQKDIAVIIAVVFFSGIFSYVITNQFLVPSNTKKQTAETVEPVTAEFDVPDDTVFNDEAINPTELIRIAPNANNQPFSKQ